MLNHCWLPACSDSQPFDHFILTPVPHKLTLLRQKRSIFRSFDRQLKDPATMLSILGRDVGRQWGTCWGGRRLTLTRTCRGWLILALTAASAVAAAHDSWFMPLPAAGGGQALFALGTGNQFPRQESPILMQHLQSTGCSSDGARPAPMQWVADQAAAVVLRSSQPVTAKTALTCWAQLKPLSVDIDDATVEIYLREINALPVVRKRWAELKARGVRWQETYTKHARVEFSRASDGQVLNGGADANAIDGLGMDIRLESPQPLRAGDTLRAQLLRDGKPLAGMPVELRSNLSPVGIWRQTDAEGRLQVSVPLAARWLLRSVDLRPAQTADRWDSRFVTLAFEVLGPR